MNYLILAETEFFAMINEADSGCLKTAYGGFISSVISLCHECADRNQAAITLAYTENELQYHNTLYTAAGKSMTDLYVRKALAFVRKMQKFLAAPQVPPLTSNIHPTVIPTAKSKTQKSLQWTGNTLDLVELVYGLSEMGCIDNGCSRSCLSTLSRWTLPMLRHRQTFRPM